MQQGPCTLYYLNLYVKAPDVLVIEGQEAAEECVQKDARGLDVSLPVIRC